MANNAVTWPVVGLVAVVLIGAYLIAGNHSTVYTQANIPGANGTQQVPNVQLLGCPTATVPTLNLSAKAVDFTLLPAQPTAQATAYIVFNPGATQLVLKTGTLSASTGTPVQAKCQQNYPIMVGNNGGTGVYNSLFTLGTGTNQTSYSSWTVYKASQPTVSVVNALGTAAAANVFTTAHAASQITNITVYLRAGQQYTGKPGRHIVTIWTFNNPDLSSVVVPGAPTYGGRLPSVTFVNGQNQETAYALPSGYNFQYITPQGAVQAQTGFPVVVNTGNPFSVNEFVGLVIQPTTDILLNGTVQTDVLVDGTGANVMPQVVTTRFLSINSLG